MWPSSTLPTMWSRAWKSRLGCPSFFSYVDAAATYPGRYGPSYRLRSIREWMVSPYVAMAATRTVPCSSVTSSGSRTTVAPAWRAWAMHLSTSGTSRAMSVTPSPCLRWCSTSGLSGSTAPLTTKRIEPERSTNDLWSRLPFSGPE